MLKSPPQWLPLGPFLSVSLPLPLPLLLCGCCCCVWLLEYSAVSLPVLRLLLPPLLLLLLLCGCCCCVWLLLVLPLRYKCKLLPLLRLLPPPPPPASSLP